MSKDTSDTETSIKDIPAFCVSEIVFSARCQGMWLYEARPTIGFTCTVGVACLNEIIKGLDLKNLCMTE